MNERIGELLVNAVQNGSLELTSGEVIGADLGSKVAGAKGPAAVMLPLKGVSGIDREGQPFDDPAARAALFRTIRENAGDTPVVGIDHHINDA